MRNKNLIFPLTILAILLLASCANREVVDACLKGQKFGFWHGLWHGIISPVDFVLSFFRNDITVFAQNNNGHWYTFGFLLGSGGWGFMGGKGMKRRKKE